MWHIPSDQLNLNKRATFFSQAIMLCIVPKQATEVLILLHLAGIRFAWKECKECRASHYPITRGKKAHASWTALFLPLVTRGSLRRVPSRYRSCFGLTTNSIEVFRFTTAIDWWFCWNWFFLKTKKCWSLQAIKFRCTTKATTDAGRIFSGRRMCFRMSSCWDALGWVFEVEVTSMFEKTYVQYCDSTLLVTDIMLVLHKQGGDPTTILSRSKITLL